MTKYMTKYNVILPEGVPRGLEAVYANEAVRAAEARAQSETEQHEADKQYQEQIRNTLETLNTERIKREEKEEKEKHEREAKQFEDDLRARFFAGNPFANESDWARNRQTIIDEAMRERAAGGGPVDAAKQRLLATGNYSF